MSFRFRLIAIVLTAILALGGLNLVALDQMRKLDIAAFAARRAEGLRLVEARLSELFDELDSASVNLSKPREIVNALAAADNEALYDWSAAFIGPIDRNASITTIGFADRNGFIVARAPDEFRFGDSVAERPLFRETMKAGHFVGVAEIDGAPNLVATRVLRKYDDVPVGAVAVAIRITPAALTALSGSANVVVSYLGPEATISGVGAAALSTALFREEITAPDGVSRFRVDFLPDARRERMVRLQSGLSFGAVLASLVTLAALLAVLRRQLAPYQTIVGGLLEYANHATGLGGLRTRLSPLRSRAGEVGQVADALTQMIDAVDARFRSIREHADEMEEMARIDALTALANRRGIEEALELEARRARRFGGRFSVILADIDHFKVVNDSYGHPTGDAVLRRFAELLQINSRGTDTVGRWGGEEFLLLCPDTEAAAAATHAEHLRRRVAEADFPEALALTASFGIATASGDEPTAAVVARADRALYAAKAGGRNRVNLA